MDPAPARLSVLGKERWIQRQLAPPLLGERKMDPALGLATRIFWRFLGFANLDPSFFLGLGETGWEIMSGVSVPRQASGCSLGEGSIARRASI